MEAAFAEARAEAHEQQEAEAAARRKAEAEAEAAAKAVAEAAVAAAAGGAAMPERQISVTLDGVTYTLEVTSSSTAIDLKAALAAKRGCAVEDCYVVSGGRPMTDEDGTTLGQHGVGKGRRVEVRGRRKGGGLSLIHI